MTDRSIPIRVARTVSCTPAQAWAALTDHAEMVQWYFEQLPAFQPERGFKTHFQVSSENRVFTHRWHVLEVHPTERITYEWTYDEYPGTGVVTFVIEPQAEGCKVEVINEGLHTFPDDVPEFRRESCEGGWNYFMNRLATYLNSNH